MPGSISRVVFYKDIVIDQLAFASRKFLYAYFCNKAKVIGWVHLDAEIPKEHIAFL